MYFFISYFTWVFIQMLSPVLPWSPWPECTEQYDCRDGLSLFMSRASHMQWEVAILILINTSASIIFRIVKVDYWLKSQQVPLLGLDPWPFRVRGKPMNRWTTLPPYLRGRVPHDPISEVISSGNIDFSTLLAFTPKTNRSPTPNWNVWDPWKHSYETQKPFGPDML